MMREKKRAPQDAGVLDLDNGSPLPHGHFPYNPRQYALEDWMFSL